MKKVDLRARSMGLTSEGGDRGRGGGDIISLDQTDESQEVFVNHRFEPFNVLPGILDPLAFRVQS